MLSRAQTATPALHRSCRGVRCAWPAHLGHLITRMPHTALASKLGHVALAPDAAQRKRARRSVFGAVTFASTPFLNGSRYEEVLLMFVMKTSSGRKWQ